ncbi:hypothetical protein OEZ85_001902 [Tetradesmus obliquus]|uniref:phosphoglucomutase (alpha-D-glucose-1,6-bisphosphate-dependent) n=1 Tax=Tetradesmus obliquus TaxID=3088 RepID=A0ABY8U5G4_TETOB|nr:hypothetical protein OEZ85_001902 [Tetradesmus obliquus]
MHAAAHLQRSHHALVAPKRQTYGMTSVRGPCSRSRAVTPVTAYLPPAAPPASADVAQAFKRLQNGSDVRGVALAVNPGDAITLTPAAAFFIAAGFVDWLRSRGVTDVKVAVGCDPRVSGPLLMPAVLAGLQSAGAAAVDVGLSTTPAMFYGIIAPGSAVTGSIMLTASHMPMHNNGLKFFTAEGGLGKPDIAAILEGAAAKCEAAAVPLGDSILDAAFVLRQGLHSRGGLGKPDIAAILEGAAAKCEAAAVPLGDSILDAAFVLRQAVKTPATPSSWPLLSKYAEHLRHMIVAGIQHPQTPDKPLTGLKIAVDAGNGSGGFFATQVLEPLGADVSGSQFLEPDGTFPNHIPNPENKAAMDAAVNAVKQSGADLGIVFDTDVDRSAIVGSDGTPINSNRFIALMAAIVLQEHPGSTIVTDSVTSNGLTTFIEQRGGKHFRFKRGYKNVISKGVELNKQGVDCELMMETSGHGAMRSNHYLDDGSHLALTAVVAFVRSRLASGGAAGLGELLADLQEPAEAAEYRIGIKDADFKSVGSSVLQAFHDWVQAGAGSSSSSSWSLEPVNHEGWRVNVDEGAGKRGWALLRQSLHDPLLVLNVESDVPGGEAAIRGNVLQFFIKLQQAQALDLAALQN